MAFVTTSFQRLISPAVIAAASISMIAGGCATTSVEIERSSPSQPLSIQQRTASPGVWGAERGVELISWIVADAPQPRYLPTKQPRDKSPKDGKQAEEGSEEEARGPLYTIIDNRKSIQQALAPYENRQVPVSDELRFRWHAAGFRIVAVPVADLPQIQKSLRIVGPTQRQWLGEFPLWTDLVRGQLVQMSRTLETDTGPTYIESGRLRLLARSWIVPDPQGLLGGAGLPAAALRLELVPQHEPQLSEPHRLLAAATNPAPEAQGRLFSRLALGMYLRPGDALIIIPDSPESDWSSAAAAAEPAETPDEDTVSFRIQSLGEAMLTTPGTPSAPNTRAVIVVVPHVPQRYELTR